MATYHTCYYIYIFTLAAKHPGLYITLPITLLVGYLICQLQLKINARCFFPKSLKCAWWAGTDPGAIWLAFNIKVTKERNNNKKQIHGRKGKKNGGVGNKDKSQCMADFIFLVCLSMSSSWFLSYSCILSNSRTHFARLCCNTV